MTAPDQSRFELLRELTARELRGGFSFRYACRTVGIDAARWQNAPTQQLQHLDRVWREMFPQTRNLVEGK